MTGVPAPESKPAESQVLVEAVDLVKHFPVHSGAFRRGPREVVHAVDGVSLAGSSGRDARHRG